VGACAQFALAAELGGPTNKNRDKDAMSRKRQLPPDICRWQSFRNLSHDSRLLYLLLHTIADDQGRMLLHTIADDQGRMREDPGLFAFELFPGESAFGLRIEACLREIEREGLIGRYDIRRSRYLVINAWAEQKIDHPKPSTLPAPPETRSLFVVVMAAARAKREH
jgi:hypothetical protein